MPEICPQICQYALDMTDLWLRHARDMIDISLRLAWDLSIYLISIIYDIDEILLKYTLDKWYIYETCQNMTTYLYLS